MAVRLRLRRTGTKNKACYRIVAADSRSPRDGRFIEILGYYDPRRADEKINLGRAEYWMSNGAQPSKTVAALIKRAKDAPALSESTPVQTEPVDGDKDKNVDPDSSSSEINVAGGAVTDKLETNSDTTPEPSLISDQKSNPQDTSEAIETKEETHSDKGPDEVPKTSTATAEVKEDDVKATSSEDQASEKL